jgi:hypothetical protein
MLSSVVHTEASECSVDISTPIPHKVVAIIDTVNISCTKKRNASQELTEYTKLSDTKRFRDSFNDAENNSMLYSSVSTSCGDDESESSLSSNNSDERVHFPRKWTREEDNSLREAIGIFGELKWQKIAAHVGTRGHG